MVTEVSGAVERHWGVVSGVVLTASLGPGSNHDNKFGSAVTMYAGSFATVNFGHKRSQL